jgi:CheY-like chemotaxis protein
MSTGGDTSKGAGMSKRTVLLADDDAALRRLVGVTLGRDRFALLTAGDGEEALAVARTQRPETILLDVNMPRLDGLEVCRALKADPATAHIKILILTGNGSEADRQEALAAGADGYLAKPFSPIALLEWMQDDD